MKTIMISASIIAALLTACSTSRIPDNVITDLGDKTYREHTNVLIIYYDHELGKAPLLEAIAKHKAEILYEYKSFDAIAIRLHHGAHPEKSVATFAKVKGVTSVQRDKVLTIQ